RHLRPDLVQVQRQAVDHVLARLRRRPGEVGDEADPDRPRLSGGHADTREEEDQQGAQHDREPVRTHGRSSWWTGLRQMIAPSACYRDGVRIALAAVLLWATTVSAQPAQYRHAYYFVPRRQGDGLRALLHPVAADLRAARRARRPGSRCRRDHDVRARLDLVVGEGVRLAAADVVPVGRTLRLRDKRYRYQEISPREVVRLLENPRGAIPIGRPMTPALPAARFAPSGPDAEDYGASDGHPTGDRTSFFRTPFLVGSHSQLDQVFEGRLVRRAATPSRLGRAASEPAIQYYYQGAAADLDRYLSRNPATGLLVARGDTILIERYQYGRNDRHRFTSWSMAKTVTSMLVGI